MENEAQRIPGEGHGHLEESTDANRLAAKSALPPDSIDGACLRNAFTVFTASSGCAQIVAASVFA
jgi:hypothetical protein